MKRFINFTSTPLLRGNLNFNLDSILCWLNLAAKNSRGAIFHKTSIYWWNESLDTLKSRLKYLNRKRRTVPYPSIRAAYNQKYFKVKREFRYEIKRAKDEAYRSFITVNITWGRPYKCFFKSLNPSFSLPSTIRTSSDQTSVSPEEVLPLLLKDKFQLSPTEFTFFIPTPQERLSEDPEPRNHRDDLDKFLSSRKKSAPGEDKITYTRLKSCHRRFPHIFSDLIAACRKFRYFPASLKTGKVCFLSLIHISEPTRPY